jgi:hypothetical protein
VSCEGCEEIRRIDGVPPDCETDKGCRVPPLSPAEARVLRMRSMLLRLRGLVAPEAVLRAYGATMEELELLAMVEAELGEHDGGN